MSHFLYLHWQSAKQALLKILRQPFGSLLTLLMLSLALALPLSLYLVVSSIQTWASQLHTTPQISLYLEAAAEEADHAAVESSLRNHPKIASYRFISKTKALEIMEKRAAGTSELAASLGDNPLPDVFEVTPKTLEPRSLEMLQKELSGLPMVADIQFDAGWAKRLYGIAEMGRNLTWFLAVVLGLALILITHNAVRMQILARQDEIEVSKLIGATDSFIRRPFMYHAMWQGVLATLLAWGLTSLLVIEVNPSLKTFAQLFNTKLQLRELNLIEIGITLASTALLAMLGARLAANHYLRQTTPQ